LERILGKGLSSILRCRFVRDRLYVAVGIGAGSHPDDEDQADDDTDHVGNNVKERVETEGYFPS
jgi:hypothetical protein